MSAMSRDPVTHGTHDPPQMMTADHIITAPHRGKQTQGKTIQFLIENVKKGVFENLKM